MTTEPKTGWTVTIPAWLYCLFMLAQAACAFVLSAAGAIGLFTPVAFLALGTVNAILGVAVGLSCPLRSAAAAERARLAAARSDAARVRRAQEIVVRAPLE